MKTKEMTTKFGKYFPKKYAVMNHDFVGPMLGKLPETVHKVLLCLDCDLELLPLIKEYKPELIITHHPFFFGSKAKILKFDEQKRELAKQIEELGAAVYSLHTNFDCGKGGMNDALLEALELQNIYTPEKNNMMRVGYLNKEMDVVEFAKFAKERFNVDYSLLINKGKEKIKSVAIIGGGGSRSWRLAKDMGVDIYISGDAPHYVRRDIVNNSYNYLDMPHEIEKIFMPTMKKFLLNIDPTLEIICIDHEELPKVI